MSVLSNSIDLGFYRNNYPELHSFPDRELSNHYCNKGINLAHSVHPFQISSNLRNAIQ